MYFDVLLLYQNLCCTGCISCMLMYQFVHGLASRHNWRFWMSHCVQKRSLRPCALSWISRLKSRDDWSDLLPQLERAVVVHSFSMRHNDARYRLRGIAGILCIDDHDVVGLVFIVLLVGHRTCVRPPLGESVALPSLGQCLPGQCTLQRAGVAAKIMRTVWLGVQYPGGSRLLRVSAYELKSSYIGST